MMLLEHMQHDVMGWCDVTMLSLLWGALWGAIRPLLHDVVQCRSGAGGGCGPGWDVAAVVEHDTTRVHDVVGSNVKVACRMGWPHMIWAKGWGCACECVRSAGDSISPPVLQGLGHTPPTCPMVPFPVPFHPGVASHSHAWGQMSPTCCIPAMGPVPCPCTAWLHPAWVPMALPALFHPPAVSTPAWHLGLVSLGLTMLSRHPGVTAAPGVTLLPDATTKPGHGSAGTRQAELCPAYKQNPIASDLRWSFMVGPWCYQQHAGDNKAFPI